MHVATVSLKSISPYSQSRKYRTEFLAKESKDDYEKRTWRDRIHADENGMCFIPPMCFKKNLEEAAQFLGLKIPGKRNATWTKHFKSGILVLQGLELGVHRDEVHGQWLYLNADGRSGSGTRVDRCMPFFPQWSGVVTYHVIDDEITQDVFTYHLEQAGQLIGIGRFRPRNGGFYGRFKILSVDWK